ncbi:MAG: amidohydrolase family protein [Clostridiaceae bacterium]|jgi:predicted TIM-barrel fold metal-dependent hydrolase|nr:amidohydrolase family protein [Clostridiaceae bacterium]
MEEIKFFDCNCSFGRRSVVDPGSFYKAEDLKKRMEHYGIAKALVYHSLAREYSPMEGNKILMEEIQDFPGFYPMWVVMPHHTGEFYNPEELKEQLKKYNVRAVRMFPSVYDQYYSTENWNCGKLFSMLESCRIPLFLGFNQVGLHDIVRILTDYPNLPVILTELVYSIDRNLYGLLGSFGNLKIELSGYKVHNGVEEICAGFGAERIVFGSMMPVFSGGSAVSVINYACISQKEKQMIAHENIEKLLEGVVFT